MYRHCKEPEDSALNSLLKNYRTLAKKVVDCPFAAPIDQAIELMENWLTIRDHKAFFETITQAREEAARLFDGCKNVNLFVHEQFDKYSMVKQFLTDNHDNFTFLDESQKAAVEKLKSIGTDQEPWDRLPSYMKMKRTLEGQLRERKAQLVATIRTNYNKVFDELDEYAKSVQVSPDKYAKRDATIMRLTSSDNFYALQANADADRFYEMEMAKINQAIVIPSSPQPANTGNGNESKTTQPTTPAPRKRMVVHLNTHTTTPIRTEADIDLYLQSLKEEFMQYIGGDSDIIIK